MSDNKFREGAFVANPRMPDWGVGKILEIRDGGNLRVFFEVAGEKIMPPGNILPAAGGEHPLLADVGANVKPAKPKSTRIRAKSLGR